jgi:hypothetical protein
MRSCPRTSCAFTFGYLSLHVFLTADPMMMPASHGDQSSCPTQPRTFTTGIGVRLVVSLT